MAQNPATTITLANRNIVLPCGTSCTSISAQVPHIKQTGNYVITKPAYVPFSYTTPPGATFTVTVPCFVQVPKPALTV